MGMSSSQIESVDTACKQPVDDSQRYVACGLLAENVPGRRSAIGVGYHDLCLARSLADFRSGVSDVLRPQVPLDESLEGVAYTVGRDAKHAGSFHVRYGSARLWQDTLLLRGAGVYSIAGPSTPYKKPALGRFIVWYARKDLNLHARGH